MWFSLMPEHVLYGIISFLVLAVVTLGGLWVRTHDKHREWATEQITEQATVIAVLQATHVSIKEDMGEIRKMLDRHLEIEEKFQRAIVARLGIKHED